MTGRAIAVSLGLVVAMCWWIAYSEVRTGTTELTCTALPIGVVFALFVVALLNLLLAKRLPGRELAPGELAVIYVLARNRYIGWPFHPAGYAVANTFITDLLWFPFFLGRLAKWLTLRYGGMIAYRRALPFFIGLILGDYVIASLWTLVGIALGIAGAYQPSRQGRED